MSAPVEGQLVRLVRGHEGWDLETTETCTQLTVDAGMRQQDCRRLAACWNACAGIPTEALEAGVVKELVESLDLAEFALSGSRSDDSLVLTQARAALAKVRP